MHLLLRKFVSNLAVTSKKDKHTYIHIYVSMYIHYMNRNLLLCNFVNKLALTSAGGKHIYFYVYISMYIRHTCMYLFLRKFVSNLALRQVNIHTFMYIIVYMFS